jgi:hypothetical protein
MSYLRSIGEIVNSATCYLIPMRQKTRDRVLALLAVLERSYETLKANNQADLLADHNRKQREIDNLLQEWNLSKGNHARREALLVQITAAQKERMKLWRKWKVQSRDLEANLKEEFALKRDIEDLKSALSSIPLRL